MSGKRKALSADDKKQVMVTLMHTTRSVFTKDELMKLGDRAGVVEKTVMDAIETLIAERAVEKDKIGSGVFYWAFTTKALASATADAEAASAQAARDEKAADELEAQVQAATAAQGGTNAASARAAKALKAVEMERRREALKAELLAQADRDPEVIAQFEQRVKDAKSGADRWTENVWAVRSHLVKKLGLEPKRADAMLGISDSFGYIE